MDRKELQLKIKGFQLRLQLMSQNGILAILVQIRQTNTSQKYYLKIDQLLIEKNQILKVLRVKPELLFKQFLYSPNDLDIAQSATLVYKLKIQDNHVIDVRFETKKISSQDQSKVNVQSKKQMSWIKQRHIATYLNSKISQQHFYQGIYYHSLGNSDNAVRELKKAILFNPCCYRSSINLGLHMKKLRRFSLAKRMLRWAIKVNPNYFSSHYNYALILEQNGQRQKAIQSYREALKHNQNSIEARYNLANNLHFTNKKEEAVKQLEQALKSENSNYRIHYLLAIINIEMKNLIKGVSHLKQALKIKHQPQILLKLLSLKSFQFQQKQLQKNNQLNKSLRKTISIYVNLGYQLKKQRKNQEAIKCYTKVLQLDPTLTRIYSDLGVSFKRQNKNEEAIKYFKKAVFINPTQASAYCNLGILLSKEWRNIEAINCYRKAIHFKENVAQSYCNLGILLSIQGDFKQATHCLISAIKHKPIILAYYNLGRVLKKQGKDIESIYYYKTAILINPKYALAYFNLGISLKKVGKTTEAAELFEKTIDLKPNFVQAYCYLGVLLKNQGKLFEAYQSYKKSLIISPQYCLPYFFIGNLLNRMHSTGQDIRAKVEMQQTISSMKQKALADSKLYFSMSLFYISSLENQHYYQHFIKFIDQFLMQRRNQEDIFKQIQQEFETINQFFLEQPDQECLKRLRLLKLTFYNAFNFNHKILDTFDKVINEIYPTFTSQLPTKQTICQIIEKQSEGYTKETKREYISYLLKYLIIKFEKDLKLQQTLIQLYYNLKLQQNINPMLLKSTILAIKLSNFVSFGLLSKYQSQALYQLSLDNDDIKPLNKVQNKCYESYMAKINQINIQNQQGISQNQRNKKKLEQIFQSQAGHIETLGNQFKKQLLQSKKGLDYFLTLQYQNQDFQDEVSSFEQYYQIAMRVEQQVLRQSLTNLNRIKMYKALEIKQKIKLLIAKICYNFVKEQGSERFTEQNQFIKYSFDQKLHLFEHFIRQTITACKDQQISQQLLQNLNNILKEQLWRKLAIQIYKSFNFFVANHKQYQKKFYWLLCSSSKFFSNKLSANFKIKLAELVLNQKELQQVSLQSADENQLENQALSNNQKVSVENKNQQKDIFHTDSPQIRSKQKKVLKALQLPFKKRYIDQLPEIIQQISEQRHVQLSLNDSSLPFDSQPSSSLYERISRISVSEIDIFQEIKDSYDESYEDSSDSSLYNQSFCEQKAKTGLLNTTQQQKYRQLIFKNHLYMIRYLSRLKGKLKWIAEYKFYQKSVTKRENRQDSQYQYFKCSLTKGKPDFLASNQAHPWYTKNLWSRGIKSVLLWVFSIVSAIKQLQQLGIYHPDLQFRNTILVDNNQNVLFKEKYLVIDFDYAFKIYQNKGQLNLALFEHTKNMITHFVEADLGVNRGFGSIFVPYMFRDIFQSDSARKKKIINKIYSKCSLQQKVEFILVQLQKYSLFYHQIQLLQRLKQLIKQNQMVSENDLKKVKAIKLKLEDYYQFSDESMSYQQMRQNCKVNLYDKLLDQLQQEII